VTSYGDLGSSGNVREHAVIRAHGEAEV